MDYLLSREYQPHIYVMVVGLVASLKSLVAFHLSRVADDFKIVDAHYSIFNV